MSNGEADDGDDDQESPLGRRASQFLQAARNRKTKEDVELIRLALHTNPFFTCMDEEQIERFIKAAEFKVYEPEQTVILEGYIDDDAGQDRDDEEEERQRQLLWDEKADVEPYEYLEEESMLDPTASENYGDTSEWQNNSGPGEEQEEKEEKPLNLRSGMPSYVYCIRSGAADVWHNNVNTASFGAGTIFGVGGFLFHRQHSATVAASPDQELECWAVPADVFRNEVLPSDNMVRMFSKYASPKESDEVYMTMDEFIRSCTDREEMDSRDPRMKLRMANTFNILRKTEGVQKINLANFSLFHLLMARPDPEVDIAFLLMDDDRTGTISLANLRSFLELNEENQYFDLNCEFVRRHFGEDGKRCIRYHVFPQFLAELPKEMGRQAFLYEVARHGSSEGYIGSKDFVRVLRTACGWRLPAGVGERLENLYCREPKEAAEATARTAIASETLKGSNIKEKTKSTTASILANMEKRSKDLGDRCFAYSDFLAFQEVLGQLPGICNLIQGACAIKRGPISPDDFKVANRVIGLGGKLSRRQVEIVFQLFDLDQDGYIAAEDTASVVGVDFVYRLEAVPGREGKLTFAPPPDFHHDTKAHDEPEEAIPNPMFKAASEFAQKLIIGGLAGLFGALPAQILWPADLVKSRMQMDRIRHDGVRRYVRYYLNQGLHLTLCLTYCFNCQIQKRVGLLHSSS
jgi:Ca2+-binding EF-hand superfamily protein